MAEVFPAKSGDLTASVNGTLLHSRYDPRREAERFVSRTIGTDTPATVLVLGTGIGYVVTALRRALPNARILSVSVLKLLREEHRHAGNRHVELGTGENEARLYGVIRPEDAAGLLVVEWEPELRLAPDHGRELRDAVKNVLATRNADVATTSFFGRSYIRNAVRAALFTDEVLPIPRPSRPVCIAASGPTLERATAWMKTNRARISLWALSSAYSALSSRGIEPDYLVQQDAGFYAAAHLAEAARLTGGARPPVITPLTAMLPPRGMRRKLALFSQSTTLEREVLRSLGASVPSIRETGTVAASAVRLALDHSEGPVYLAGLDLAREDIKPHALPHASEPILAAGESRFSPIYAMRAASAFDRSSREGLTGRWRRERSLDAYASWFRTLAPAQASRLRRIEASPVELGVSGAVDGNPHAADTQAQDAPAAAEGKPHGLPPVSERAHSLAELVGRWRQQLGRCTEALSSGTATVSASDAEIAYLVSASDYVGAVACARRGDASGVKRYTDRLSEAGRLLFSRLEHTTSAVQRRGTMP